MREMKGEGEVGLLTAPRRVRIAQKQSQLSCGERGGSESSPHSTRSLHPREGEISCRPPASSTRYARKILCGQSFESV